MFTKNSKLTRQGLLDELEDYISRQGKLHNSINKNDNKSPQIFLLSSDVQVSEPSKRKIPIYDLKIDADIERLTVDINKDKPKANQFNYVKDFTKLLPIKVIIKPVAAIGNQLGVFIDQDVPDVIDGPIYFYVGELKDKDPNNDYTFVYIDKNGKEWYIDGETNGDLSRFFNNSAICNLYVEQSDINGKPIIGIHQGMPLKKGDQLLFDYGPAYKRNATYKLRFLDPSDNEYLPEEIYQHNRKYYAKGAYSFDEKTCSDFKLEASHWLLPEIMTFIYEKDYQSLRNALKKGSPVDSLAYSYDDKTKNCCDFDKQQHLTPLMIACYLGDMMAINILLRAEANVDRCTLNDGYSALTMLLKGHASNDVINKVGPKILNMMRHPFAEDEYDLTILHYAIKRNATNLVETILKLAEDEKLDIFKPTFNREFYHPPHADLNYCLVHGQFDILQLMIKKCLESKVFMSGNIINEIKSKTIFSNVTFAVTPLEHLIQFQKMINEPTYFQALSGTDLLSRLKEAIETKQLTDEPAVSNCYEYTADYYFKKAELSKVNTDKIELFENAVKYYQHSLSEAIDRSDYDILQINASIIYAFQKIIDKVQSDKEKKYYAYQLIKKIQSDIDLEKIKDIHDLFDIYHGLFEAYKIVNDQQNQIYIASKMVELFPRIERMQKIHVKLDKKKGMYGKSYNSNYVNRYKNDYEQAKNFLNQHQCVSSTENNNNNDENNSKTSQNSWASPRLQSQEPDPVAKAKFDQDNDTENKRKRKWNSKYGEAPFELFKEKTLKKPKELKPVPFTIDISIRNQ